MLLFWYKDIVFFILQNLSVCFFAFFLLRFHAEKNFPYPGIRYVFIYIFFLTFNSIKSFNFNLSGI